MKKQTLDIDSNWLGPKNELYIVAGPCSAESEEQVLETARAVARIEQVTAFRAGIWKPRTRPSSFEGVGREGLKWLKTAKEETGLATAVEVAKASHVSEALEFGIDILWVGARTSASPFAVQEIADALRGVNVPVWVKNPVNPDLQLWIGALERLNNAGIRRLGAIHRGFTTTEQIPYRNAPHWGIPVELKRFAPELPIICDPSHIAGAAQFIERISQNALDLTMSGLMIETHPDPPKALSDAEQQLRPDELAAILSNLKIRNTYRVNGGTENELTKLRQAGDAVDYELLEIIARRMEIVKKIGGYKKKHNMKILQAERWKHVVEDRMAKGRELGLDDKLVLNIYELLHECAIRLESEVINEDS